MALIWVFPPSSNDPPVAARTEDEAEAKQRAARERRYDDMSILEGGTLLNNRGRGWGREKKEEKVRGQGVCK